MNLLQVVQPSEVGVPDTGQGCHGLGGWVLPFVSRVHRGLSYQAPKGATSLFISVLCCEGRFSCP